MNEEKMAKVKLVEGGGLLVDEDGHEIFLKGYGAGLRRPALHLDPRIDLTQPIWEQVQRLDRKDKREPSKPSKAA